MSSTSTAQDQPIPVATGAALPDVDVADVLHVSAEISGDLERKLTTAFDAQTQGRSTRVVLAPGVYRVSLAFPWAQETPAVVVIEAEQPGTAVFSGADVLGGWRGEGESWRVEWPYRWGAAPAPPNFNNPFLNTPELMLRREMVVIDGVLLRQTLSRSDLAPGTFHVDDVLGIIALSPPPGVDQSNARVEVAMRSVALHLVGRKNVIVRGLMFRHDASFHATPECAPLQISSCQNVLIEDCRFVENNNKGLYLGGSQNKNITIRNSSFTSNGCIGLNAANCVNLLIENCETSLNNWRGDWAGVYRRWPCGLKISRSARVTVRFHRAVQNMATGGWIDLENRDVRIENSLFYGNYRGLHLEAGVGPFLVCHCQIIANTREPLINEWRWAFGSGIVLTHASNVTLRNNFICDNEVGQVGVRDDRDKHVFRDPASGVVHEWRTERVTLESNVIAGTESRPTLLRLPGEEFDDGRFWRDFRASGNVYFGRPNDSVFMIGTASKSSAEGPAEPAPPLKRLNFDEWRQLSGQDHGSTYIHDHRLTRM